MRTDKELIQYALDNIDELKSGLCNLALKIFINDKKELLQFLSIIHDNKPYNHVIKNTFWWKCGSKPERISFLKLILEKYGK